MNKESRLSFRISDSLDDEIEKIVIIKHNVRDRSDLGNQAMEFYLKLLKKEQLENELFMRSIIQIAEKAGKSDLAEIKELKDKLAWLEMIQNNPLEPDKI